MLSRRRVRLAVCLVLIAVFCAAGCARLRSIAERNRNDGTFHGPVLDTDAVVALDAGHDAVHAGASYFGLNEADAVLVIAKACREELEEHGVRVIMTRRSSDCPVKDPERGIEGLRACLSRRVERAEEGEADLLVSFHLNALEGSDVRGAMVYVPTTYYGEKVKTASDGAAAAILEELAALGLQSHGLQSEITREDYKNPDGSPADNLMLIREAKWADIPCVLIEHAFLDSPEDYAEFLDSEEKLEELGRADARGILRALGVD